MNLSKNLTLEEVTKSTTAIKYGIDNTPNAEQIENLKYIANTIFQPTREHFGKPIMVSSGFRSVALCLKVGSSAASQHAKGEALDLDADTFGGLTNLELFHYILNNLPFDQLIAEGCHTGKIEWVHVSATKRQMRKQPLVMYVANGKTVYAPYSENELKKWLKNQ